jgi:hypothetical protein
MLRRIVNRNRAAAVLALVLGILPVASRALPPGSEPAIPAAVRPAQAWLSHLARLLDGFWSRVTANTGVSIDPNGKPDSVPGAGPSADDDTGKSIDPNG